MLARQQTSRVDDTDQMQPSSLYHLTTGIQPVMTQVGKNQIQCGPKVLYYEAGTPLAFYKSLFGFNLSFSFRYNIYDFTLIRRKLKQLQVDILKLILSDN